MDWSEPIEKIILYPGADLDVLVATWLFKRNVPYAKFARFEFVKIGETWKNEPVDSDPSVVHIDTGMGKFDHHGGKETSITKIMARELDLVNDQALKKIFELVESYEKAEKQAFYSPSQLITGWYYMFQTNPRLVIERAFEVFDIIYGQEKKRIEIEAESDKVIWKEQNGKRIAVLEEIPQLRDWAFEHGAELVVWKGFNSNVPIYGAQVSRDSEITLEKTIVSLRKAEAEAREINTEGEELEKVGELEKIPGWFLHQSGKLILCGSRKKSLKKEEVSKLSFPEILQVIFNSI